MFAVGTCYQLSLLLLMLIILPTVIEMQEVQVQKEVTGYLDQDVTLPCRFITEHPSDVVVAQMQWTWTPVGEEKEETVVVFSPQIGLSVSDSPLKERVAFANTSKDDFSLTIKAVMMTDKGEFTCTLTTFPTGSLEGTTSLTVQELAFLPAGVVTGIVVAVILLLIVMAAIAFLVIRMRHSQYVSAAGHPTVKVARTSKVLREEDLIYIDTRTCLASPRINDDSDGDEHKPETPQNDDVIYSQVRVSQDSAHRSRPLSEGTASQASGSFIV